MTTKLFAIVCVCLALSGCWNGGNTHVSLGNVSLGTQLLDLKTALDQGAITQEEFDQTKRTLLALNALCEQVDVEEEEDSDESFWF